MKNGIKEINLEYYTIKEPLVLSWKYESEQKTYMQEKYRICIFDGEKNIYDTKQVKSKKSTNVILNPTLEYEKEYKLTLYVETTSNEKFEQSTSFETELQSFKSDFLSVDVKPIPETFELFTTLDLTNIKKARLYLTTLGIYALYIDGKRVEDFLLAPGWTTYDKMLQYQTYDIKKYTKKEKCELKIIVGRGWYRGHLGYICKDNHYGFEGAVLSEIHLFDKKGNKKVLSDDIWTFSSSQITSNDLFNGEIVDFNLEKKIYPVKTYTYSKESLLNQIGESVRKINHFSPKSIKPFEDKYIIDFGYNLTGYVEIKLKKAIKGRIVKLRHAEVLNKDGSLYTENLRSAKAEDMYILSDNSLDLFPHFTFHGFRYVELSGIEIEDIENIKAIEISSKLKQTGFIKTNDKSINTLIDNIFRSNRGNFVDVPTDCPQRDERCGWTGDANVFCRSSAYNYYVKRFFKKWLRNMILDQNPDGRMSNIIPRLTTGNNTACLWADSIVMIPYTLYSMYGDVSFISMAYEGMKKYIDYILENNIDAHGVVKDNYQFADWLSLDKDELNTTGAKGGTDDHLVANMFFSKVLDIFVKSSKLVNKKENEKKYKVIRKNHLKALRDEYFTKNGRLVCETQTAFALALAFDIADERFRKDLAMRLDDNIKKHGNHLTTGFAGTPFLLFALTDNGYHDTSSKLLLNHTYPSWLYEVDCGATTIWERWNGIKPNGEFFDPGMNSFNHYAYGSVIEFMYRRICGIDYISDSFENRIRIEPHYTKGLYHVKSSFDSIYGKVEFEYVQIKNGMVKNIISVPSNTFALVKLPGQNEIELSPGKYEYTVPYENLKSK